MYRKDGDTSDVRAILHRRLDLDCVCVYVCVCVCSHTPSTSIMKGTVCILCVFFFFLCRTFFKKKTHKKQGVCPLACARMCSPPSKMMCHRPMPCQEHYSRVAVAHFTFRRTPSDVATVARVESTGRVRQVRAACNGQRVASSGQHAAGGARAGGAAIGAGGGPERPNNLLWYLDFVPRNAGTKLVPHRVIFS